MSGGARQPEAQPATLPVAPLTGPVDAVVPVPGSKSLTNRALLCAALAKGTSHLSGVLVADDTRAMIAALRKLGSDVDLVGEDGLAEVVGLAGGLREGPLDLDVNLSGTCARFLLPVLGIGPGPYRLDGAPPLRARPMSPAITALRHLGVEVGERGHPGHLPVVVDGTGDRGVGAAPGSLSSQFVSGLLLAAPCYRDGLAVELADALVSRPYVSMTRAVMARLRGPGDELGHAAATRWRQAATGPASFAVEPDASSASYFFAAAALAGAGCGSRDWVRDRSRATWASSGCSSRWGRPSARPSASPRWRGAAPSAGSTSIWPTCPTWPRRWPRWPCSPRAPPGCVAWASSGATRPIASPRW